MKLSNKAKKNFAEDNEFYIKLGKRLRQARRTKVNEFYIKLGKRLRQARRTKVNEFTGKETIVPLTKVAKALKNTYQQIGKYEKGENRIPLINLVKISKFLKKPMSFFLDDYEELDVVAEEFNIAFQIESEKIQENK